MAISPDRITEKQLQSQIRDAKKQLEGTRAKLVFSKLAEKPQGLNGATKAFEYGRKYDQEILQRVYLKFREVWIEVMPVTATQEQRDSVAISLGWNSEHATALAVTENNSPFPKIRNYFVTEQMKGG